MYQFCLIQMCKTFFFKLPAKPKCMFPCTALGMPLLKIGTMLTKAVLLHFIQLGCVQIFTPFGDFSLFRLQRVKIIVTKWGE
jgi:hypothetical protein